MTDETKATTAAARAADDAPRKPTPAEIKRGYRSGTYLEPDGKGGRREVPNFHVLDEEGRETGHATLDPERAAELAGIIRARRAADRERRRIREARRNAAAGEG